MEIKAMIFDIDGTMMPQGGPIKPVIAAMFRVFHLLGIPSGVATGKNADYSRGLACGIGDFIWDFIIAETGAQFLKTTRFNPPAFDQRRLAEAGADLYAFFHKIGIDPYCREFDYLGKREVYRPELKEGIITFFPPGMDITVTEKWVPFFEAVISTFNLRLKVHRFSDGCIDIVPSEVNKFLGVQEVCRIYGCEPANILVGVDGVNDLELMLGTQVIAVGNAVPKIKEVAKKGGGFIADRPDGFGLAQGIAHYARQGAFGDKSAELLKEIEQLGL